MSNAPPGRDVFSGAALKMRADTPTLCDMRRQMPARAMRGFMRNLAKPSTLLPCLACFLLQACGGSAGDAAAPPPAAPTNSAPPSGAAGGTTSGATGGPVAAASGLQAELFCDPAEARRGLAELRWTPADPPGQEQRVLVTIFKGGFASGAFEESKPLPPDQDSYVFESVQGQAVHRWRVLTVGAAAETSSETARFEGPLCIYDEVIEAVTVPIT